MCGTEHKTGYSIGVIAFVLAEGTKAALWTLCRTERLMEKTPNRCVPNQTNRIMGTKTSK